MKKKLLFFLIALLPAIAASSQTTVPGFRVTYKEITLLCSQTFPLDSVIEWGSDINMYNTRDVFIKTVSRGEIRIWEGYVIKIEYPEIRITPPPQDYLVVQVDNNEAVFCMDAGFEMTWKGTLDIKNSYQSQSIGLDAGINFKIERRTYGYVNPSVSSAIKKTCFLVVDEKNGPASSFSGSYKCAVEGDNLVFLGNSVIKIAKNRIKAFGTEIVPRGIYYR